MTHIWGKWVVKVICRFSVEIIRYKYVDWLWLKINGNKKEPRRHVGDDVLFEIFLLCQSYRFVVCCFAFLLLISLIEFIVGFSLRKLSDWKNQLREGINNNSNLNGNTFVTRKSSSLSPSNPYFIKYPHLRSSHIEYPTTPPDSASFSLTVPMPFNSLVMISFLYLIRRRYCGFYTAMLIEIGYLGNAVEVVNWIGKTEVLLDSLYHYVEAYIKTYSAH